jgi:hypothetical protein
MTPQDIRDKIESQYPEFYGTESHKNNVEKGHYQNIDHALLAQIYSLVRVNDSFFCDKTSKPMRVSLAGDDWEETAPAIEEFESEDGIVYVLKIYTYTKDGKEIIKIGFTTQDTKKRLAQLFTTGVPFEFEVHTSFKTKNFIELETALHKLLDPFKINKSREFFTEDALPFIEKIAALHKEVQEEV